MNGSEFPLQLPPSDPPFIWDFGLTGFNQRTNQSKISDFIATIILIII
jgi:hypothetical protein